MLNQGQPIAPPPGARLLRATDWYASFSEAAAAAHTFGDGRLDVRRFSNTPPEIEQPALSDTVLCMHLGGPKEVHRHHAGRIDIYTVPLGALTIMPAGESNRWHTRGPIEYAHIAVGAPLIARVAHEEFECEPSALRLRGEVGFRDPLLEQLFTRMLREAEGGETHSQLYRDSLLVILLAALFERQGERRRHPDRTAVKGGLAAFKMKRIDDYLQAHLDQDVPLADLSSIAGLSRAQFFRAFRQSTGTTPQRYLKAMRLERAHTLLAGRRGDEEAVAISVGLRSASQLRKLLSGHHRN